MTGKQAMIGELYDQEMPNNLNIEEEVLGGMMIYVFEAGYAEHVRGAFEMLGEKDFYSLANRRLFQALKEAWSSGKGIGSPGLALQVAKDAGIWDKDGRKAHSVTTGDLCRMLQVGCMAWDLPFFCAALRRLRVQRAMRSMAWEFVRVAYNQGDPIKWCKLVRKNIDRLAEFAAGTEASEGSNGAGS